MIAPALHILRLPIEEADAEPPLVLEPNTVRTAPERAARSIGDEPLCVPPPETLDHPFSATDYAPGPVSVGHLVVRDA